MIGDTIFLERTRLGMTQEKLSDYLHLTKATISKWENNQAKPDIDYLILLAKLFDMSLDDLVGFQKTLSDSERSALFHQLKKEMNHMSDDDVVKKAEELSKQHISDFKTLLILIQLVLSNTKQVNNNPWLLDILNRIISKTTVESDLQAAIMLKVVILFQNKDYDEIISLYQNRPYKLGEELFLANSFAAKGDISQAKQVLQVEIYQQIPLICQYLLNLTVYESANRQELIFSRLEQLMTTFQLKSLHPNTAISCYYGLACHSVEYKPKQAISYLKELVEATKNLLQQFQLHGDHFFDAIDPWLEELPTGTQPPSSAQTLVERVISLVKSPNLQPLGQQKAFQDLLEDLEQLKKENTDEH